MKTQTVCIFLAIVIVLILGYAAMNGGKLWGKEYYGDRPGCKEDHDCMSGKCILNTRPPTLPSGHCAPR